MHPVRAVGFEPYTPSPRVTAVDLPNRPSRPVRGQRQSHHATNTHLVEPFEAEQDSNGEILGGQAETRRGPSPTRSAGGGERVRV